ncbi:PA2779 family protein [Halorhodospira halochloris]|uniref:PA2779 family protein n=1 Tax=Halorhodospira halochloris TaxID=1052 RepID=UPI001EE91262|nr:PA2779 family protein [Halorhodospira halochloris]MCG5548401.1 PA2779 family protein [Halorhodospira halochloris]
MKRFTVRSLIVLISLTLAIGMIPATALAGVVGTSEVVHENQASADRAYLQQALEREEMQDLLAAQGVDLAEAEKRVAALSDEEVRELVERMDQQPVGAGVSVGATTILLVIIIWLLVR